jgi:hypothetical protein
MSSHRTQGTVAADERGVPPPRRQHHHSEDRLHEILAKPHPQNRTTRRKYLKNASSS